MTAIFPSATYRFYKIQYLNSMNSTAYRARFRQNGQLKCQPVFVPFGVAFSLSLSISLFFPNDLEYEIAIVLRLIIVYAVAAMLNASVSANTQHCYK